MPRASLALLVTMIVLSIAPPASWAGTRYHVKVGGNDALNGLSPGTAWATIRHAAQVMQPGDSVLVTNGHYHESVQTIRSGTSGHPIVFMAAGDSVFISPSDDLDDSAFRPAAGYGHVYRLDGWSRGGIRQTHFNSILIDDPANPSHYLMTDDDGPIALTTVSIASLADVESVEGSYLVIGDTLFVHPYDDVAPGNAATDLWSNRGQVAFEMKHDYIVIDGFKFFYADSPNGAFHSTTGSDHGEIRNCYFASAPVVIQGSDHTIRNLRGTHNNFRRSSRSWITGNEGTGVALLGVKRVRFIGGELWHNWNNMASEGDTLTVDGVKFHGAPNHNWAPQSMRGLTIRNVISYNAQDGLYLKNCENVLIENTSCFGGFFAERVTEEEPDIGLGPITIRNCLFQDSAGGGIASFGSTSRGTPVDMEARTTYQHCLFFKTHSRGLFQHLADSRRYDLDDYVQHATSHPGEPHSTFTACRQVSRGFDAVIDGGAWTEDTDAWDVHILDPESPAHDTGSALATGTRTDFEGDPRPQGGSWDIGADEYSESPRPPLPAMGLGAAKDYFLRGNLTASLAQVQLIDPAFDADVETPEGRAALAARIEELLEAGS